MSINLLQVHMNIVKLIIQPSNVKINREEIFRIEKYKKLHITNLRNDYDDPKNF